MFHVLSRELGWQVWAIPKLCHAYQLKKETRCLSIHRRLALLRISWAYFQEACRSYLSTQILSGVFISFCSGSGRNRRAIIWPGTEPILCINHSLTELSLRNTGRAFTLYRRYLQSIKSHSIEFDLRRTLWQSFQPPGVYSVFCQTGLWLLALSFIWCLICSFDGSFCHLKRHGFRSCAHFSPICYDSLANLETFYQALHVHFRFL